MRSRRLFIALTSLFTSLALLFSIGIGQEPQVATVKPRPDARPSVEIVFCLDTTGSMGGLINAAKATIWSIANQIVTNTPTARVKIGLVAYRDRGDEYVTRIVPLTDDLDTIHEKLNSFKAAGGGDAPESVNQALYEAVTQIFWSKDSETYRCIFLVGDAPPHMDYPDDVKYPESCKLAANAGILINTIQCGNMSNTRDVWQEVAKLAKGDYLQLDANGGPVRNITTPYDAELAKINLELTKTTLVFGNPVEQTVKKALQESNMKLAADKAAERAAYNAQAYGGGTAYDLLTNVRNGNVDLAKMKKEELPQAMQSMTLDEQKAYLAQVEAERKDLSQRAIDLNKQRSEFLAKAEEESRSVLGSAGAAGGAGAGGAGGFGKGAGGRAGGKGGGAGGFGGAVGGTIQGQMRK